MSNLEGTIGDSHDNTQTNKTGSCKGKADCRLCLPHPLKAGLLLTAIYLILTFVIIECVDKYKDNLPQLLREWFAQTVSIAGILTTVCFGLVGWFGSIITGKMHEKMNGMQEEMTSKVIRLTELNQKLDGNIANLEEAVRLRLRGIPEILGRAIHMLEHAKDDLFIVTFTVNFGVVHKIKYKGTTDWRISIPGTQEHLTFDDATTRFSSLLLSRSHDVKQFRFLTVNEASRTKFLTELKDRDGYGELKQNKELYESELSAMNAAWEALRAVSAIRLPGFSPAQLRTTDNLPFQMILARMESNSKDAKPRENAKPYYGCLVFLVSSTTTHMNEAVAGFYTELDEFIEIYRNIALRLFEDETDEVPVQDSPRRLEAASS